MMTPNLKDVVETAGIAKVFWIDDRFDARPTGTDAISRLTDLLARLKVARLSLEHSQWPFLEDTDIAEYLGEVSEEGIGELIGLVEDKLRRSGEALDYSTDQLAQVQLSFGNILKTIGFDAWPTRRQTILAELDSDSLVIIDNEPGYTKGIDGKILLEEVTSKECSAFILMLTHSVTDDESADNLRRTLDAEEKYRDRFAVISKSQNQQDLTDYLSGKVRAIVTRRASVGLSIRIAKEILLSVREVEQFLMRISISTLDKTIFDNSLEEGASELDVLMRLFALNQREHIESSVLADSTLGKMIGTVRALRALGLRLPQDEDSSAQKTRDALRLLKWRHSEVYESDSMVNLSLRPLRCGDIFAYTNPVSKQTKHYILLGQPCEMAVRKDGKRRVEEAVLVRFICNNESDALLAKTQGTSSPQDSDATAISPVTCAPTCATIDTGEGTFQLPSFIDGQPSYLKLRDWATVSLRCMEFASFNKGGHLAFFSDDQADPLLLPGWAARFQQASVEINKLADPQNVVPGKTGKKQSAAKPDSSQVPAMFQRLCFQDGLPGAKPSIQRDEQRVGITFGWKRIGSLRSPWNTAAYAAFSTLRTRTAFEHDFVKDVNADPGQGSIGSAKLHTIEPETLMESSAEASNSQVASSAPSDEESLKDLFKFFLHKVIDKI